MAASKTPARGSRSRPAISTSIALQEHQAIRLGKRTDIWIEARGTAWLGRSIKLEVQMGDLRLTGEMPAEHFERFEHWKLGLSRPRSIAG